MKILGATDNAPTSAGQYKHLYGVQFHPEVTETEYGAKIYENFVFKICHARDKFPAKSVAQSKIDNLRNQIAEKRVLLALSGGSDSSVVAYLLKEACSQPIHRLQQKADKSANYKVKHPRSLHQRHRPPGRRSKRN